jgi:hypothetical protein
LAIDRDPAFADQTLHIAARSHARTRQQFGDALAAFALIAVSAGLTVVIAIGS